MLEPGINGEEFVLLPATFVTLTEELLLSTTKTSFFDAVDLIASFDGIIDRFSVGDSIDATSTIFARMTLLHSSSQRLLGAVFVLALRIAHQSHHRQHRFHLISSTKKDG
jgi:hypothetical protein